MNYLKLKGDDYLTKAAPNGERRDCVVRATASALDIPYWQAHKFYARNGRKTKSGTDVLSIIGKKTRVIFGYRFGFHKCPHKTVGSFVKKHPEGTYIIVVRRHAFCLKDGKVIGQNQSDFGQHVEYYWYISKTKTTKNEKEQINEGRKDGVAKGEESMERINQESYQS